MTALEPPIREDPDMKTEIDPLMTATDDYWPPGPLRVLPPPPMDGALAILPSSPTKVWIRCPGCSHPAWRDFPGEESWTCGCRSCHGVRQVMVGDTVQIEPKPFVVRPFPAGSS